MDDLEKSVILAQSGEMDINQFLSLYECSRLIKSYAAVWHRKTTSYGGKKIDGREFEDRLQLSTIGCWEAVKSYDFSKGAKFSTFYRTHMNNKLKNLYKSDSSQAQCANMYDKCWSYDFTITGNDSEETSDSPRTPYLLTSVEEEGYIFIEVEMLLRGEGFDDTTIEIVKCKMENPDVMNSDVAKILGYSRQYVGLLWNKVKSYLSSELQRTL